MSQRTRMIVVGVIVPLLIAAAAVIVMLLALPTLPDPVAIHWGASGVPDSFGTPVGMLLLVPGSVLAYSVLAFAVSRSESTTVNQRVLLAVAPFLATLLGVIGAGGLVVQRGLADAHDSPSILPVVGIGFGAALLTGVAAWFVLPAPGTPSPLDAADALDLGPEERATWIRRLEPARWLGVLLVVVGALVLAGTGAALWAAGSTAAVVSFLLVAVVVVVLAVASLFWTVRIDARGVVARSVLGFPRFTVPVDEVEAAASVPAHATTGFGGWGLRWGGPGRVGIILSSGEALEVRKKNGGALVVTTGDSERAAALLNSLVRAHAGRSGA
jgi:hypothetical protein